MKKSKQRFDKKVIAKVYVSQKLAKLIENLAADLTLEEYKEHVEKILRTITEIKKKINETPKPLRVETVHEIVDLHLEASLKRDGIIPICREGCSHCCHIHVVCSMAEAKRIWDYTKEKQIEIDFDLCEAQAQVDGKFNYTAEGAQRVDFDFLKIPLEKRKCVFLKDGRCQVYELRPIRCRTHLSGEEDSSLCRTDDGEVRVMKQVIYEYIEILVSAFDQVNSHDSLPRLMLHFRKEEESSLAR